MKPGDEWPCNSNLHRMPASHSTGCLRNGAGKFRLGALSRGGAHHDCFAMHFFGSSDHVLRVRFWFPRICRRSEPCPERRWKAMGLDWRGTILLSQIRARRLFCLASGSFQHAVRRTGGPHSARCGGGALAIEGDVCLHGIAGRFHVSVFNHWVRVGGWLDQVGINYGLGHGFIDVGGSGWIQAVGGLTALSIVWILGPRRGKYSSTKMPNAIPAHSAVFVVFGGILCWVGWLGLNSAGAILFGGATPGQTLLVIVNTTLAAAAAGLSALIVTGLRFGRPDASLTCNGWIGGLVASSAGCLFIKPAEAVVIGAVAGILVPYSVEWLEFGLKVDDPGGSISAHAAGGIWGLLAVGLFARFPAQSGSNSGQFIAQLVGVATLLGFVLPFTYGVNRLLNWLVPYRVSIEGERQGMDLHELGADAYPEFVVHTEEFIQR